MTQDRTIKAYIDAHLGQIQTIDDIADAFSILCRTVRRRFRQNEGMSLCRYITRCRILRMKRLLRTTDYTHRQIAYAAGYERDTSAARAFKRVTGQTMTAYREQHRDA